MKRLLLVSHRPLEEHGGLGARWRSLCRYLPAEGWETDVVSASRPPAEFSELRGPQHRTLLRARVMGSAGRLTDPAFALAGLRPEATPPSMLWVMRGAREVRRRLRERDYDAVLATGPPMVALLAARAGLRDGGPPLVLELRDLWAGNPYYDRRGELLGAVERWLLRGARAVIACTPEAVADLRRRHPGMSERIVEIPNGFEPKLLDRRESCTQKAANPITILHSGTLTPERPLRPLLTALADELYRSRFRLVLHGYVAPASRRELAAARGPVEVIPPSSWRDAIERICEADATLVTQSRAAGDSTAVAAKVYEYLALGKPVLCLTDGGATEGLLRRLGADALCARLGDERSIGAALDRLLGGAPPPPSPERLAGYDRRRLAARMAAVLDRSAER